MGRRASPSLRRAIMSKNWYQQSINALQLNGKGERTQKAYTRALRQMVDSCGKPPAKISEAELEAYFLHRRNVDGWSPNTMRTSYCGIRFFFVNVLKRDWHLFQILRAKSESRLPAVRTFGCLSLSFGMSLDELKARVEMAHGFAVQQAAAAAIASPPARCCRYCGGPLRYRRNILP